MTDRVNGFFVTLKDDMRIDDAESIIHALSMVKGVAAVSPNVSDPEDHIARVRVRQELIEKLFDILNQG